METKQIPTKEYRRRIAEISEILSSAFTVSDKVRKELLAKQQRYVAIINQSKR